MFKHKIFDLLRSLDQDEFKKLGDFVNSPYFSKSRNVIEAYNYVYPHYPSFKDSSLSKFKMYEHLFKSENYKDSSLRNVMAKLVKAVETFLIMENLKKDELNRDNLLLEELIR